MVFEGKLLHSFLSGQWKWAWGIERSRVGWRERRKGGHFRGDAELGLLIIISM